MEEKKSRSKGWILIIAGIVLVILLGRCSGDRKYEFTEYREELQTDGPSEDYKLLLNEWNAFSENWKAQWYVNRDQLKQSIAELNGYDEEQFSPYFGKPLSQKLPEQERFALFFGALYGQVMEDHDNRLDNIVDAFLWYREKNDLSNRETADLVIKLIQEIPYEIPDHRRYGFAPPLEVLYAQKGDCDSKSVLGAVLLEKLGFSCVFYVSSHYEHAMLGIDIPSIGEYQTYEMQDYYYVEMTAVGWQIGDLPSSFNDPQHWVLIPIN